MQQAVTPDRLQWPRPLKLKLRLLPRLHTGPVLSMPSAAPKGPWSIGRTARHFKYKCVLDARKKSLSHGCIFNRR
jgi:hypothetical protein